MKTEWIKCSNMIPDNHNLVIVYMTSGATTVGRRLNTNKWGMYTSTGIDIESQTNHVEFWMPLPEPPTDKIS